MFGDHMRLQRPAHPDGGTSVGRQNIIVFQGEMGANSHVACRQAYPEHRPAPCPTFEDAFAAVASGAADLAMIPIENSVAGRVPDIHHLMPSSGLNIGAEWFLPVRHQLMAPKGAKLSGIKSVESHGMALGQCRKIIRRLGVKPIVAADTAGSAREVAQGGDMTRAAIAPRLAAEIYGLDILAEDVEDEPHNTTRFIVLAHRHGWAAWSEDPVITTLVFRVRNVPAALYKALGGFVSNGVNMTKIESYMLDGDFFATQFYADIEGHPNDRRVRLALEELAFFSKELKILGVYPAHPFRSARETDRLLEPALPDANIFELIFGHSRHNRATAPAPWRTTRTKSRR
jgi:prephenate dehydratase